MIPVSAMTRRASFFEKPPILRALLAYGAAILLIAPWGDFPLNDDWCFAHVAKKLVETGQFRVDVPITPSTVGQPPGRAFSPVFLYLSLTFVTEIYGWSLGLLGAVLWLRARARADGERAAPDWATTLGTAAIVAATFWIRQSAVVIFPALIGAYLLEVALERDWTSLRRAAPRLGIAVLVVCAVVIAYFAFAESAGGLRRQMSGPLSPLLKPQPEVWLLHLGTFLVYMALFFYPLFTLVRFRGIAPQILKRTSPDYGHGEFLHRGFPFMGISSIRAGWARSRSPTSTSTPRGTLLKKGAWLVPLAVFTVCGLHDYFRWNEARWQLFDEAVTQGTDPARIDRGYEIDGWILKEPPAGAGTQACIGGRCHCDGVWWHCQDASYRIGMNVVDGYEEVRRLEPMYWLAGAPLILSKRAPRGTVSPVDKGLSSR